MVQPIMNYLDVNFKRIKKAMRLGHPQSLLDPRKL